MTDVSPSRRRLGRCLLAGAALMLPLTASFSYAAAAQDNDASAAPAASAAPTAPAAPAPPAPPEAPVPPEAARAPHPQVHRFELRRGPDGKDDRREQQIFVFRSDGPLTEAQRKQFEAMRKDWEKQGAEWRAHADEWRKMAETQRQFALAHMPEVSTDCDKAGEDGTRSWTDDSGRRHVVICQRIIRDRADMAKGHALMSLRMARNAIAGNDAVGDSVKQEVLADLDKEIARLEADKH